MRLSGWLIVGSLLASGPATGGGLLDKVQNNFKDLISKDFDTRSSARDAIKQQFELSTVPDQTLATDELLLKIRSADPSEKLTAAIALSKLTSPWLASDHDNKVKDLYQTFLTT